MTPSRVLILFLILLSTGCDSGSKARPLAEAVDNRRSGEPVAVKEEKVAKPTATDPAARAILDKIVAAHTAKQPGKLEALRQYKATRKGKMTNAAGRHDAAMTVAAVYPDRYRSDFNIAAIPDAKYIFGLHPGGGWHLNGMERWPGPQPLDEQLAGVVAADVAAEWATMVVPLADLSTLALPVTGESVGGKPAEAVRVWIREVPLVVVADPVTGCVANVRYQVRESGSLAPKAMAVVSYQLVNGVQLPGKLEYSANTRVQAEWTENQFEFPASPPAAAFEKP
jgi:hypothetical protein